MNRTDNKQIVSYESDMHDVDMTKTQQLFIRTVQQVERESLRLFTVIDKLQEMRDARSKRSK